MLPVEDYSQSGRPYPRSPWCWILLPRAQLSPAALRSPSRLRQMVSLSLWLCSFSAQHEGQALGAARHAPRQGGGQGVHQVLPAAHQDVASKHDA